MPLLIQPETTLKQVYAKRTRFRSLLKGQVFYYKKRWWMKRTTRTAAPADEEYDSANYARFKDSTFVWAMRDTAPRSPLTFEQFINDSSL